MAKKKGVCKTRELTPQWQLMMKCWKMNLRPGQASWWGPTAWRVGAIALWAWKLRTLTGPGFTCGRCSWFQRVSRAADGEVRQDLHRPSAADQNATGAAGDDQAVDAQIPPRRYW
jgi:hypothetical protein